MSIIVWAQVAVFTHVCLMMLFGTGYVLWVELPVHIINNYNNILALIINIIII